MKKIIMAVLVFYSASILASTVDFATNANVVISFNTFPEIQPRSIGEMTAVASPQPGPIPMPNYSCSPHNVSLHGNITCRITPLSEKRPLGYPIQLEYTIPYVNSQGEQCTQFYKTTPIVVNPADNPRTLNCRFDTSATPPTCDDPMTGTIGVNTWGSCQGVK